MIDCTKIHPSWQAILNNEFEKDYLFQLDSFLEEEAKKYTLYPSKELIFNAFALTPFHHVKVVILGQDPYHGVGQAHGLSFSVPEGIKHPKSLINIFKELHNDLGVAIPKSGNLEKWALQGVFLLNATLTVRAHQAGSHQRHGWEIFTDHVIQKLSEYHTGLVFMLWGNYARKKSSLIDTSKHHILESVHPSPLSAYNGFFGCKHFSKANKILKNMGKTEINWQL